MCGAEKQSGNGDVRGIAESILNEWRDGKVPARSGMSAIICDFLSQSGQSFDYTVVADEGQSYAKMLDSARHQKTLN